MYTTFGVIRKRVGGDTISELKLQRATLIAQQGFARQQFQTAQTDAARLQATRAISELQTKIGEKNLAISMEEERIRQLTSPAALDQVKRDIQAMKEGEAERLRQSREQALQQVKREIQAKKDAKQSIAQIPVLGALVQAFAPASFNTKDSLLKAFSEAIEKVDDAHYNYVIALMNAAKIEQQPGWPEIRFGDLLQLASSQVATWTYLMEAYQDSRFENRRPPSAAVKQQLIATALESYADKTELRREYPRIFDDPDLVSLKATGGSARPFGRNRARYPQPLMRRR